MDNRIIKYFNQELHVTERISLLREIKDNESLKKEFIEYRNTLGLIALSDREDDEYIGKKSYRHFQQTQKNHITRKRVITLFSYAASVAILIIATYLLTSRLQQPEIIITENTLRVPPGQRANLTLSDGTEVWVNANSTLTYPSAFIEGERSVKLSGEAFFEVKKDNKHPFLVSSENIEIKVLGTIFNIKNYPTETEAEVSLLEGSVEVTSSINKVTLRPNEYVHFEDGEMTIGNFYNENDFSWKHGIYTFDKVSLLEIIQKLELYYDVKIIVNNQSLANKVYIGKFRQRDGVMEILKILQQVHPFKIKRDEINNIITLE